ncbi:MAG: hypothetical protein U1E40_16815 [Amaricoccus sp.]
MGIAAALPRDRLIGELSLWSADLADLARVARPARRRGGRVFAPAFLFFPDLVARIAQLTRRPIHVHLMVEAAIVEAQTRAFVEAGAALVTVGRPGPDNG